MILAPTCPLNDIESDDNPSLPADAASVSVVAVPDKLDAVGATVDTI